MRKMALSAMIRQVMPTTPLEGVHSTFGSREIVVVVAFIGCSLSHSYFQSGSVGCLMSQSGRRLLTVGISAKLYSGGGELVVHSRVQASHGSFPAGFPLRNETSTLITKISMATAWNAAPIVQIRFNSAQPRPASYV